MGKTFRAAISGLGNIAWQFDYQSGTDKAKGKECLTHAYSYMNNNKTLLIGGYSPDKLQRNLFSTSLDLPSYDTFEEMIDKTNPDIISICSPSDYHFEQTMQCIEREIPMIWLEKPPASSLDQIEQMLDLQRKKNETSKILVNYQRRYMANYQDLKKRYDQHKLDPCRLIQINYSRGLELNGSHMLDILFFITGDSGPQKTELISSCKSPENPGFALILDSGTTVIVSGLDLPYHCIDITLTFERGRVSVIHGGMTSIVENRKEHDLFPGFYKLGEQKKTRCPDMGNAMTAALNDLINAHGQNRQPLSNLGTSKNTMALIQQIRNLQKGDQI